MFEAFSRSAGLEEASREACNSRLEALGVVYDLMELPAGREAAASPGSVRATFDLVRAKASAALGESQPVEAFSFLGLEITRCLPRALAGRLGRRETSEVLGPISGSGQRLLAESVVESLAIRKSAEAVESELARLRGEVSRLTRKA